MAPHLPAARAAARRPPPPWFPAFCLLMGVLLGVLGTRILSTGAPGMLPHPSAAAAGGPRAVQLDRPSTIAQHDAAAAAAGAEAAAAGAAAPDASPAAAAAAAAAADVAPAAASAGAGADAGAPPLALNTSGIPVIARARRRAYAFYAADHNYMCSVLVNIHRLQTTGAAPDVSYVVILPHNYNPTAQHEGAAKKLGARFFRVPPLLGPTLSGYYRDCMAKLYVFNLTDFDRVVFLDADSIVLKPLDALFELPDSAFLAAPRAYWLDPGALREGCGSDTWKKADGPQVGLQMKFTSAMLVVSPSVALWERIYNKYFPGGKPNLQQGYYDMDLLNVEFKDEVALLRGETLLALTAHWATKDKDDLASPFAGKISPEVLWNLTHVVHFSPMKPWTGNGRAVRGMRPQAHPRYWEAFETWDEARKVACG